MKRFCNILGSYVFGRCLMIALFVLAVTVMGSLALAQTPAERIFPDTTKGFFSIRNLEVLGEQWKKTQLGTLMNDPIMEEFKKDLQAQLGKRMEERFGITFDEISQLPSGELAAGMIAIPGEVPGYAFTMDVSDRREQTVDYIERLSKKLQAQGVKRSIEQYKSHEIVVFQFPDQVSTAEKLPTGTKTDAKPLTRTRPPTGTSAAKSSDKDRKTQQGSGRRAYYLLRERHLLVADCSHLIRLICDRYDDFSKNSLGDVEDFQVVMKKCLDDLPVGSDPLIRWYIEPLNYGESVRVLMQGPVVDKRKGQQSIFSVLKEQGFDAIRGVGGTVGVKAEDKEVVYRVFVYTKKPYRLAMRMLVFPDSTDFTLPTWLPSDLARCTMLYVDPLAMFDNFGTLFDALVMQGETGVWDDIIEGLRDAPDGPKIDIRKEIVVYLGSRVLGLSKYHLPITPQSESIVVAVELQNDKEQEMKNALKKLFQDDSEMQSTEYDSFLLWHRVPMEDLIVPNMSITGVPDLVSRPSSAPAGVGKSTAGDDAPKDAEPMFPEGAVTVAEGYVFVSTDVEYLKTILDRLKTEGPSIVGQHDYKKVENVFADMGITDKSRFLQFFARTDVTIQPTYELVRQNKMPQSKALLGKAINSLVSTDDSESGGSGVRKQSIDGSKLPEFSKVKQYFGPAGLFGASEENGYFFKGFILEKTAEEVEPKPMKKPKTKPKPEGKFEVEPKPVSKLEVEPKPEGKIEVEPKPEGKLEVEPKPASKLEVEPKPASKDP